MAQTYDYSAITNERERRERAMKDIKFYLGDQYKRATEIALEEKAKGTSRLQVSRSIALFLGIEGYPVSVWLDSLGFSPDPN